MRDAAKDNLLTPTMNSWEDPELRQAVERTGRKKLILAGLWTEVCVAFPALDALQAGYEVFVACATGLTPPIRSAAGLISR